MMTIESDYQERYCPHRADAASDVRNIAASTVAAINALWRQWRLYWMKRAQIQQLRQLDDHQLRDIGLTLQEAERIKRPSLHMGYSLALQHQEQQRRLNRLRRL